MGCVETMNKRRLIKLISMFSFVDGGLYKRGPNHNAYFAMNMLTEHEDYIDWVKETIEHVTSVNKAKVKNPCKNPQTNLRSKSHPLFTKLHSKLYIDGYKGIYPHLLKMIDWECLAIMYMCDGCFRVVDRNSPNAIRRGSKSDEYSVTLNMKRLSYGDQFLLKKLFKEKFDLEFNINKQTYKGKTYYHLRLRTKDIEKFMYGIRDYVLPSFNYKVASFARRTPTKK